MGSTTCVSPRRGTPAATVPILTRTTTPGRSHRAGGEPRHPRWGPTGPGLGTGWGAGRWLGGGVVVVGAAGVGLAPRAAEWGMGKGEGGGAEEKRELIRSMCLRCRGELTHTRCRRLLQLFSAQANKPQHPPPPPTPTPPAPGPINFVFQ